MNVQKKNMRAVEAMMNQRNESVTLDNMLEPLDELAPRTHSF